MSQLMSDHFDKNKKGRDFVCSDLHGELAKFYDALREVNFDESKDRVFCGGDLVDRGPDSYRCMKLVEKPWFYSVRGNHEDFCLMGLYSGNPATQKSHESHGGEWFYQLKPEKQAKVVDWIKALPYALDIETDNGLVGMVHADCLVQNWDDLLYDLEDPIRAPGRIMQVVWGDLRFRMNMPDIVNGVYRVYVGHRPVKETLVLGNVWYIDGGACFSPSRKVRLLRIQ